MSRKKRLHELARELDVTTDRLMEIAMRNGMRFTSNFNAVEPEQEERLRIAVKGPVRVKKKPTVKIVKTAKQKMADEKARAAQEAALAAGVEAEAEAEAEAGAAEEAAPVVEAMPEPVVEERMEEKAEEEIEAKVEAKEEAEAEVKAEKVEKTEEMEKVEKEEVKAEVAEPAEAAPKLVAKEKIEIRRPVPPPRRLVSVGPPPPSRRKRRRRRKGKVAAAALEAPVPGKKRAKQPTKPKVDHVLLTDGMTLKDLADKLGIMAKDVIQKLLLEKGVMASINQVLNLETAKEIAEGFGVSSEQMSFEEEIALVDELQVEGEAVTRAPVVALLGHVDHGKTTLLDYVRKSNIVAGESGGITQHIGAYKISSGEKQIVFLDTPGHEAFTRLRARGAQATDIVLLVVAADDGVMPQTVEAIQHALAAEVPIIVVITKTDLPRADVEKVKKGLAEHEILVEGWGGDTVCVEVSGKTGDGVDELLEMIILVGEMRNLRAYPDVKGLGTVLEARLDRARGPVATVLVQNGTLRVGEYFIAGTTTGRVKAMISDRGERVGEAMPSTPIEVLGFASVPEAGDQLQIVADENKARQMVAYRRDKSRETRMSTSTKLSLDDLFSRIEEGEVKELPIIIKGDVRGSLEALSDSLEQLSTERVRIDIKLAQPGAVTDSDILLASASSAIVIGFNVKPQKSAAKLAEEEGVEIRLYSVIYEVIKDMRDAMRGLLEPTYMEVIIGKAEVRETFRVPKVGMVAGCYVTDGEMQRNARVRLIRDDVVLHDGKTSSLKRFKDDVRSVKSGYECGIGLGSIQDIRQGDVIEMYRMEEVATEL